MMKWLRLFSLPFIASLLVVSSVSASTYYLLAEPSSSVANQSTSQRNIDLNVDLFTGSPDKLFYTYVICPTITSDYGDSDILFQSCKSVYLDGFNTRYSSYSSVIYTDAQLLYPGPNNISCIIFSSKDNFNDYQLCDEFSSSRTVRVNYTGNLFPVYRFWSNTKQHHFYTIEAAEKTSVLRKYDRNTWDYEAIAWTATKYVGGCSIGSPVYRLWSDSKQSHFYTISPEEKNFVQFHYRGIWAYEGIAYCAGTGYSSQTPQPIYRFWSDKLQGHFYTASAAERDSIVAKYPPHVWQYEGVAFYVQN